MKRKFAAFDIDGTISRTSLLQLMVRELVARGKLVMSVRLFHGWLRNINTEW
jgi:hypothetical protein